MRKSLVFFLIALAACQETHSTSEHSHQAKALPKPVTANIVSVILKAQKVPLDQARPGLEMELGVTNPEILVTTSLRNNTGREILLPAQGHRLWLREIEDLFSTMNSDDGFLRWETDKPASIVGCDKIDCRSILPGKTELVTFRSQPELGIFGHLCDAPAKIGIFSLLLSVQDSTPSEGDALSKRALRIHGLKFKIPRVIIQKGLVSSPEWPSHY